ncbi:MAG: sigma-70 family RNA polymerase sigma factor [Acidimicrobiaceae bacterium]|nr:sigma-70 family RNA polymerase sigma factor [Acidimicrobiaceae bacterium]
MPPPDSGEGRVPFEHVVAEHGPLVWRVCRALLGPLDAEDAWSETFLAALRAYPRLRPDSNVGGWLVTIAHRKALDQIRARSRRPAPTADVPTTEDGAKPAELDSQLRAALQALPFKQRGAVVYRYLADLSYSEIAGLLECSEAAARRSAADGIAKLRTLFPQGAFR